MTARHQTRPQSWLRAEWLEHAALFTTIALSTAALGSTAHAERTVKGRVERDGSPLAGARVRVYDDDSPLEDERMGEQMTDAAGRYSIQYRSGTWDGPKVGTAWRPDIFVVVAVRTGGAWVRVAESGKRGNHKVANDLTINLQATSVLETGIPGEQCPAGPEFDTTDDKWQGCKCPGGYYKRWLDVVKWKARCAEGDSPRASCEAEDGLWAGSDNTHGVCADEDAIANALQSLNPAVNLYHLYFAAIGSGVELHKLHPSIVAKYDAYYGSPLAELRIGVSKALTDTAMTNCHTMYFPPGFGVLQAAVEGAPLAPEDAHWLFHELAHTAQCTAKGGVNNYAADWFRQVGTTLAAQIAEDPRSVNARALHDQMPMEVNADQRAGEVCSQTSACDAP